MPPAMWEPLQKTEFTEDFSFSQIDIGFLCHMIGAFSLGCTRQGSPAYTAHL